MLRLIENPAIGEGFPIRQNISIFIQDQVSAYLHAGIYILNKLHSPDRFLQALPFFPTHQVTSEDFNDADLWTRFKAGDHSGFELIYRRHVRALHGLGRQLTEDDDLVSDAIQELFIHIWERRADLGNTDNIRLYLFKALRRKLVGAITKEKRFVRVHDTVPELYAAEDSVEYELIRNQADAERSEFLKHAMEQLTNRQREAIYLRFFAKLSFQEVADVMSLGLRSTYNLISRALDELRRHFPVLLTLVSLVLV